MAVHLQRLKPYAAVDGVAYFLGTQGLIGPPDDQGYPTEPLAELPWYWDVITRAQREADALRMSVPEYWALLDIDASWEVAAKAAAAADMAREWADVLRRDPTNPARRAGE